MGLSGLSGSSALTGLLQIIKDEGGLDLANKDLLYVGQATGEVYAHLQTLFNSVEQKTSAQPADTTGKDLVWISQTIISTATDNIVNTALPSIICEPAAFSNWNLTTQGTPDNDQNSGTSIDFLTSHPIRGSLPATTALYSASSTLGVIGSSKVLATGTVVAQNSGDSAIQAWEAGELNNASNPLPARRITSPIYTETGLTTDTLQLIENMCLWALS